MSLSKQDLIAKFKNKEPLIVIVVVFLDRKNHFVNTVVYSSLMTTDTGDF